ncbi:MAG: PaaI family thioesterase [Candidatus Eremiobacteraeota bacterium]|nr:PaaI family thioesterase [Candidatus Eremiobacteraeota bacterium]
MIATDGVSFVRALDPDHSMPMAEPWAFRIESVERGDVRARATPGGRHENPFGVVQGGFAATVLDIALGLVTITLMDDPSKTMASTTDLIVRYFAPVLASTGELRVRAQIVNQQGRAVLAEAFLEDEAGMKYAYAQSNCIIANRLTAG